MSYVCLFRKYRPQRFEEVVGQAHVSQTLQNAIRLNRIAQAYLFCGPRGVGKTSVARILAKSLNCERGPTPTPCGQCEMCQRISAGQAVDIVEIDAASNRGIDDIRSLRDDVVYSPTQGRFKLYILDEAHQVTHDAFNAFLKTLEEPPSHVLFVLCTTEPHRIPSTILSRCQRFDFKRVSIEEIRQRLAQVAGAEGLDIEEPAQLAIARAAEGSMRDALSILDQIVAYSGTRITRADVEEVLGSLEIDTLLEWGEVVATGNTSQGLQLINRLIDEGKDARQLVAEAMEHFRNLLLARLQCASEQLATLSLEVRQKLAAQAARFTPERLLALIEALARADRELRWNPQPRLVLEVLMIELTHPELGGRSQPLPERLAALPPGAEPGRLETERELAPGSWPAQPESMLAEADAGPLPPETRGAEGETLGTDTEAVIPNGPAADLRAFQSHWPAFLEQIKERRISTWALIMDTLPLNLDQAVLMVGFRPEHPFRLAQAEQSKHRDLIEEMLSEFAGRPIHVEYCMMPAQLPSSPEGGKPDLGFTPLSVDQIAELFPGSRVVYREGEGE